MDDVDALLEAQLGGDKKGDDDAPPDSEPQPTKVRPPFKVTQSSTNTKGTSSAPPSGPSSSIPKPSSPPRRTPPPPPKREKIESLQSGDFKMDDIED